MSEDIRCPRRRSAKTMPVPESESRLCCDCQYDFLPGKPFVPQRVFISYGHDEHVSLAVHLKANPGVSTFLPSMALLVGAR